MMVLIIPCAAAKLVGFSDVTQNHWAYSAIMDMTAEGIFHGTGAVNSHGIGQFSPNILMKRSEFLTPLFAICTQTSWLNSLLALSGIVLLMMWHWNRICCILQN